MLGISVVTCFLSVPKETLTFGQPDGETGWAPIKVGLHTDFSASFSGGTGWSRLDQRGEGCSEHLVPWRGHLKGPEFNEEPELTGGVESNCEESKFRRECWAFR